MTLKISWNAARWREAALRQITAQATARFTAVAERQYCAEHGRFAELIAVEGDLQSSAQLHFRFSTCCEEQRARVHEALRTEEQ